VDLQKSLSGSRTCGAPIKQKSRSGDDIFSVSVEVTEGAEREVLWQRLLVRAPFFADYQKKVERQIPMAVLTPKA